MKQFIYSPSVIGRDNWPPGELRLEGIEKTGNPEEADVFVVPGGLRLFPMAQDLYMLPYFKGNEARHVLFDVSDDEQLYGLPCIFFRGNVRTWYLQEDPNSVTLPWPVEDYAECVDVPASGFKYDLSFHGWVTSHETRERTTEACLKMDELNCDFRLYKDFFGYRKVDDPEYDIRRRQYRQSMRESRIALCPESINGVFPYRFWEALSAGRVPLLVGTDFVFPFADVIPYDRFIIQCSRANRQRVGEIALDFIQKHTDHELIGMGQQGRFYWETYLNAADWPVMMARVVRDRLEAPCTSPS